MRANREIRAPKIRLIGKDGSQIGIISIEDALMRAEQAGLDLVEIASHASPPVCKIIDYGKYRYQMTKKERESKKTQHQTKLKEVKVRPNIDTHDLMTKIKHTKEFIKKGNKVRITCTLKGRERAHPKLGFDVTDQFIHELKDLAQIEVPAKQFGGNYVILVLAPQGKK